MVRYYRKAYKLRLKQKNTELWLQGLYIYEAIGDMSPILRTSFDKTPKKPVPYPTEPYPLDRVEADDQKQRQEEKEMQKQKELFKAMFTDVNKKLTGRGEKDA